MGGVSAAEMICPDMPEAPLKAAALMPRARPRDDSVLAAGQGHEASVAWLNALT